MAMRSGLLGLLVATPAWLSLVLGAASAQQSPEARGEALLRDKCSACHAIGRSGPSPHTAAPAFRVLGQRYEIEALQEALAEGLLSGHPDMPEFSFPPRDVGAIIRYLRSIQQP